jgi:hypothetical protein
MQRLIAGCSPSRQNLAVGVAAGVEDGVGVIVGFGLVDAVGLGVCEGVADGLGCGVTVGVAAGVSIGDGDTIGAAGSHTASPGLI